MDRGLIAAVAKLEASVDDGPGQILETVGSTLVLSVGGAAGPLYGSAFRQMGRTLRRHRDASTRRICCLR